MLYPENSKHALSPELFLNPSSEYRGTPFWAWNCRLDRELLLKEIDCFKAMGMGGFHIHSRTGMATEYLGNEFMELVKACNEKAKQNEMLCWLYDEDRWPSGFAGGMVTRDKRFRERFLVFSPEPCQGFASCKSEFDAAMEGNTDIKGYFLAAYHVTLENGFLKSYKRLDTGGILDGQPQQWRAYLKIAEDNPWYNNQAYINTLDCEAISKFIEITHEKYYSELGTDFGKSIPAIFTDEPQFTSAEYLRYPEELRQVIIPFTDDLGYTYQQAFGEDILDFLPELFWELPEGRVSRTRYRYYHHLSERFASAFADTIGNWCENHGIMFTGHLKSEAPLFYQTMAVGEAMRSYRSFQLPGIDILCDEKEYCTAKQAQSAAHQYGRPGVLSELYGVTNWDFGFRGHKLQGDWLAALGVTVRVHHLSWVSMEGEAKRDYPASIGYQSPWHGEYRMIEDYFARINTALTRGKPRVRIGVLHPVESYWLHCGPLEQTSIIREELEENFSNIVQWLLFGLIDFDFISEALLPSLCPEEVFVPIRIGDMEYDAVIVPGCHTLRSTTLARLEAFSSAGGKIIFAGEPAKLVDAEVSDKVEKLAEKCTVVPFSRSKLLLAVEGFRDVEVRLENGMKPSNLLYQMRSEGEDRWLFICHAGQKGRDFADQMAENIALTEKITVKIKGTWNPIIHNALNGKINPLPAQIIGDETIIEHEFSVDDSLLVCLRHGIPAVNHNLTTKSEKSKSGIELMDPVRVTLSEPNVLLLDIAGYSLDGGEWEPEEEILRVDNILRSRLGYAPRMDSMAQPWVNTKSEKTEHEIALKFTFDSDISIEAASLALENPEEIRIIVNGIPVPSKVTGWYVDESIKTVELPALPAGKNEIVLFIPFCSETNLEWCYILGNFGVRVDGRNKRIIRQVRTLSFGDWTSQGLPFYTGNVTYCCSFYSNSEDISIEATKFENPVISVSLDGNRKGLIAIAPYSLQLGHVEKGWHTVEITAYGNRFNAFGCLHNCDEKYWWFGPNAWRTGGNRWSYQYMLKPMGIMISPKIHKG